MKTTLTTPTTLTTKEVADILRVHPETIRRLVHAAHLPCVRTGPGSKAAMRFDMEDVTRFIDMNRQGVKPKEDRHNKRRYRPRRKR